MLSVIILLRFAATVQSYFCNQVNYQKYQTLIKAKQEKKRLAALFAQDPT